MNRYRRTSLVTATAAVALLGTGCDTLLRRNEPGTNYGQIYVGSPRIEGRERLINDRGEQEHWLRDQRSKLDGTPLNVSGAVEMNSLAITAAQLGISVDPAFKLNALNQAREAASIRQSADNERAANLLQATRRDEILAKVNKGEMTFEQAKGEFEKIGIAMPASAATAAKTPVDAASVAARTVNNTALSEKSDKITPPRTDPRRADITSTPIEEFRQRLSDREVVRNEINDIRLDDLHDLTGNTLYRLTFDTTVLPQNDSSAWALVRIRIPLNLTRAPELRAAAEDQFLRSLRDNSEAAFRGIANRLADDCYAKESAAVSQSKAREDQALALRVQAQAQMKKALELADSARVLNDKAKTAAERKKAEEAETKAREAMMNAQAVYQKALDTHAEAQESQVAIFRRAFGCGSFYVGSNARRVIERHMAAWAPGQGPSIMKLADVGEALSGGNSPKTVSSDQRRRHLMQQLDNKNAPTATASELRMKRDTLGGWAIWLGEIMDAQIAADFEGHVLNCFNSLEINGESNEKSLVKMANEDAKDTSIRRADLGQTDGIFHFKLRGRQQVPDKLLQRCGQAAQGKPADAAFESLLKQNLVAAVYAATPKESVQTISEVSSNRQTKEFLLNLNAIMGTAGIAAGLDAIRSNEVFLQALRRQPLIVGFTENGHIDKNDPGDVACASCEDGNTAKGTELVFGWVLGPSFKLSDKTKVPTPTFRHSVSQRAVSAELSLPAWMSQVRMTVETSWLREDGTAGLTPGGTVGTTETAAAARSYSVRLPAQPAEVLSAIDERYLREPKVDAFQELRVAEDKPARVLITGRNLWRSTDVLIGSQRANQLTVLSDNRGVLASFDKIESPSGAFTLEGRQDLVRLSLVTSEGSVIAGQVIILPKEAAAKPAEGPKAIEGVTTRIVAGVDSKLVLPDALPAANDASVRLSSSKSVKLALLLDKTTLLNEDRKNLVFSVARDKLPELTTGDNVKAVLVLSKPSGAVELLDLVKDGVFYESEDKTRAALSASRAGPKKPVQITLKLPAKATQGFAGLAKGATKADLSLRFGDKPDEQAAATATCTVKDNACTMTFEASDAFKARLAEKKNSEITVAATLQGKDIPEITPKELTLK